MSISFGFMIYITGKQRRNDFIFLLEKWNVLYIHSFEAEPITIKTLYPSVYANAYMCVLFMQINEDQSNFADTTKNNEFPLPSFHFRSFQTAIFLMIAFGNSFMFTHTHIQRKEWCLTTHDVVVPALE